MSPLGALDRAVELGRSRWQNEQAQAALLAGLLEVGGELGTAIHLQSTDGKGHAVQQGFQELGSGRGGGPRVGLDDVPARDHIAGGELLEDYARQGTRIKSIDLDEVSRPGNRVLLGFADGVRAGAQGATVHAAAGRLPQTAMAFQLAHDAAHHGSGNPESAAGAAEPRACPCPARIALAQGQDAIGQAGRPGGLAVPVRAGRARFQGKQVQRIIAALPAVESLATDPEMAASTGHILRAAAEVHPL